MDGWMGAETGQRSRSQWDVTGSSRERRHEVQSSRGVRQRSGCRQGSLELVQLETCSLDIGEVGRAARRPGSEWVR